MNLHSFVLSPINISTYQSAVCACVDWLLPEKEATRQLYMSYNCVILVEKVDDSDLNLCTLIKAGSHTGRYAVLLIHCTDELWSSIDQSSKFSLQVYVLRIEN